MPYIPQSVRNKYDKLIDQLYDRVNETTVGEYRLETSYIPEDVDGEMNYVITRLIDEVYGVRPRYINYERAVGLLDSVKVEFQRRRVGPYEESKKEANGDVYL